MPYIEIDGWNFSNVCINGEGSTSTSHLVTNTIDVVVMVTKRIGVDGLIGDTRVSNDGFEKPQAFNALP